MSPRMTNHRDLNFSTHESIRHELQGERKSEEQKLERLKKLLQAEIEPGLRVSPAVRAA
jgi:hypothetical protein